jgi:hypothetical protein
VDIWAPTEALGVVVAAGIAAGTTLIAKKAADKSNASADTLAEIERQRRHRELTPRLRVICEPWGNGIEGVLRLRVIQVGPPGLDRLDKLTAAIRNDHFRRGDNYPERMGGPTAEQVKAHIWGPYHFTPSTAPDDARSDATGRSTVYETPVPIGEQLVYQLEHTLPGGWMSMGQPDWITQQGTLIRMAFTAEHNEHGTWYLPCEIETADLPTTVFLPQWTDGNARGVALEGVPE